MAVQIFFSLHGLACWFDGHGVDLARQTLKLTTAVIGHWLSATRIRETLCGEYNLPPV